MMNSKNVIAINDVLEEEFGEYDFSFELEIEDGSDWMSVEFPDSHLNSVMVRVENLNGSTPKDSTFSVMIGESKQEFQHFSYTVKWLWIAALDSNI